MQSVSASIWTRTALFISNDDNHYTTGIKKVLHPLYSPDLAPCDF